MGKTLASNVHIDGTVYPAGSEPPADVAKRITKAVKDNKAFRKVTASIQGEEIRIASPSRDELQEVIAFLRGEDFGIELKFGNYRG